MSHGRREVLRGVAGLGTAGLVALAGCSARAGGDPSLVERWVPPADRNQLVGAALGSSTASYVSYDGLLAHDESLAPLIRQPLGEERAERADRYDLPAERVGGLVSVGTVSVYPGLVAGEARAVRRALEGGGYEADGGHAGYRLYRTETEVVAVGEDAVLSGPESDFVRRSMQAMIDAARGEGDRRVETDEDFALAARASRDVDTAQVDSLFPVDRTDVKSGRIAGTVALGVGYEVDGERTTTELRYVFETREEVDVDAVEAVLAAREALDPYELAAPEVDGRVVTVRGTVPTWKFDFLSPGSPNGIDPTER